MTIDPTPEPLPLWELPPSSVRPTHSSLTAWSWYDMARSLAAGTGGGAVGAVLASWLPPGNMAHPEYLVRLGSLLLMYLVWALPLLLGLCLTEGQYPRAPRIWWRQTGRAVLALAATAMPLALLTAWPSPASPFLHTFPAWMPTLTWGCFGIGIGVGFALGFPRERHREQTLAAGALTGILAGALAPGVTAAVSGLPPWLAGLALHAAVLVPAGLVMGFLQAALREVLKTAWLQVLYGDHPGQHYPLYDTPITVGTDPENLLVLDAAGRVRPCHVVIRREGDGVRLETCAEEALVFRHNRRISVCELYDGDEIQIGETMIRYYQIP